MAAQNPYQLSSADQSEIRNWAVSSGLNPDIQLSEANKLLISGAAASMEDLRRMASDKQAAERRAKEPAPTGYKPVSNMGSITAPVTRSTAEGYTPSTWSVTPEQTVESRLQGLLSKGSPLLTLAETRAKQSMAGKGLLNSSMAQGEALRAMTETATPIAGADAATYGNAARFNVDTANTAAQFLAQAKNVASLEETRAANAAAAQAAADANRARELAVAAENDALRFAADAANRKAEQERLIAADRDIAQMNQRAQVSGQAADIFNRTTDNITKIMADPDLDPAAKQAAVDQQKASMDTGLRFIEQVNKIDGLTELLTFSSTPATAPPPPPPPASAAQPGTTWQPTEYDDLSNEYRLAEYMNLR